MEPDLLKRGHGRGWPDGRWLFWMSLNVAGYAWVSAFQCGRSNPFAGRDGSYEQFLKLMALSSVLYFLGPAYVLKPFNDLAKAAVRWNLLAYALPFGLGLQFFYLQKIDTINYSLNYHDLSRMHPIGAAVFLSVFALIVLLGWVHVRWARRQGILPAYAGAFAGAVLLIAPVTAAVWETRHLHIHHWFLFCFLLPFARFPNPVSTVCQAICAGIYVEGVAEWSMSTIWELR